MQTITVTLLNNAKKIKYNILCTHFKLSFCLTKPRVFGGKLYDNKLLWSIDEIT